MDLEECSVLSLVGFFTFSYFLFRFVRFWMHIWNESLYSSTLNFKKFGNWAIITGATDGIGKAISYEFAQSGLNIVLISRNEEKLKAVANDMRKKYDVEIRYVPVDFTHGDDIYEQIKLGIEGLEIAVLVNNVAVVRPVGRILDRKNYQQYSNDLIRVNINAMLKMSEIVLPNMVERKAGIIVNLASLAGIRSHPYLSLYSASKSLMIKFTKCLNDEYESRGVKIQCITPALVATAGMAEFNSNFLIPAAEIKSNFMIPTGEQYGKHLIRSIGKSTVTSTSFYAHNISTFLLGLMPDFLIAKMMKIDLE